MNMLFIILCTIGYAAIVAGLIVLFAQLDDKEFDIVFKTMFPHHNYKKKEENENE